jgi:hypothetical protein
MIEPVIRSSSESFNRRLTSSGGNRHPVDNPSLMNGAAILAFDPRKSRLRRLR